MTANARLPLWFPSAPAPGIASFATLFFIETLVRASIITVLPLEAYRILGNEQRVSFLYSTIGFCGLLSSLLIPFLIAWFARRWVYSLGAAAFVLIGFAVLTGTITGLTAGLVLRVFGTACLMITMQLYIMDYIRREQFVRNDALRMTVSTFGWTLGPPFGVFLHERVGAEVPFILSGLMAVVLIALFWFLRLSDNKVIRKANSPPPNPIRAFGRFFSQPRLRLAWLIVCGRSAFWSALFTFGPILMVANGQSSFAGGVLVGLANLLLITAWWWGKFGERFGIRGTITICFAGMFVSSLAAGLVGTSAPLVAAGILLVTALFATGLDAVGGVPFYRSVRPLERPEMASVYRTYLDAAELVPPVIYGLLLGFFGLGVVFVALSAFMLACGLVSWRYLPRSL